MIRLSIQVAAVLLVAGCSAPVGVAPPAPPRSSPVIAPPATAAPTESPGEPSEAAPGTQPSDVAAAGPPIAALSPEGGDPIEGQIGTYVWGDSGSDSPWLPGARVAVGSGEALTVAFRPVTAVASWLARYVPARAAGPEGAHVIREGSGDPRFEAPDAGTWTVEVDVTFANDAGRASYFWQLAVD